jgi:hypothetical protein
MHMLHNRRKAEIEIISTAKPERQTEILHSMVVKLQSRNAKDGPAQQTPPLLDYLLDKISDYVDAYAYVDA